ncbi:MAG TPA: protein kinase [Vicinamibacterales bacterium]|nr:protein kinase [Vicinamibacterales bacterium]
MPDLIAHYRLGTKLGQGAMGEVYRATDTKLGRDVAIKLIAPALAEDPSRLASLTREAQVLASLNHPNIAAVYGVEDQALVMELVEGPTLADRIKQGPIPLDDALGIARQIAEGLAAAHDRGIVHRDLKPANIKITPDGTVKLLDFGLARASAFAATASEDAATVAFSMVGSEAIAGTPAYMAPEQARGLPVDKRADIWAFGVVLYEMLTGASLYTGATTTDILAAVVREEPDLSRVPAMVRPVLRSCLEKDPKRRLRDAGDAILLLEAAKQTPVVEARAGGSRTWLPWAAAAIGVVAFLGLLTVHLRETPPVANTVRLKLTVPPEVTFTQTTQFAISPDGRRLAFPALGPAGDNRVWLQEFDKAEPRVLEATSIAVIPELLTWYDNDTILYSVGRSLRLADIDGTPPTTLFEYQPPLWGAAVGQDGSILYGSLAGVMRWTPGGGAPKQLTKAEPEKQRVHAVADVLPDGEHFLYTMSGEPGTRGIFVGRFDAAPENQPAEQILKTDFGAVFVPDQGSSSAGHLLIVRDSSILAQRFDVKSLQTSGDAVPVAQDVFVASNFGFGIAFYSASRQGTLVYRRGTRAENLSRQLAWLSREGKPLGELSELGRINQVKLSPDATRAVSSRTELETGNNADIWITDLKAETSTKFTFGGGANAQPVWSPDGKYIAWVRGREKDVQLFRRSSDGAGGEELLYTSPERRNVNVSDWSPDGRFLIYAFNGDVLALPVGPGTDQTRMPIPIAATAASEFGASVSPNGRWIAYISNETKKQEVYVQPFAPHAQSGGQAAPVAGRFMVSSGSLGMVRWRSDSGELVFLNSEGALVSVDVSSTPVFKASAPRVLAQMPRSFLVQAGNPGALADTTRDLQKLLVAIPSEAGRRQELSVVLNWPSERR